MFRTTFLLLKWFPLHHTDSPVTARLAWCPPSTNQSVLREDILLLQLLQHYALVICTIHTGLPLPCVDFPPPSTGQWLVSSPRSSSRARKRGKVSGLREQARKAWQEEDRESIRWRVQTWMTGQSEGGRKEGKKIWGAESIDNLVLTSMLKPYV